jgi:putative flippase GtrA
MQWLQRVPWLSLGRWWIVGLAFYGAGLAILYLLIDVLHISLMLGTVLAAEITMLLRFGVNDRWVFGHRRPTLRRLGQFHIAGAGGSAIWWIVANTLPRMGVHYLVASTAGTACSVVFSMLTNFLWIWHRRTDTSQAAGAPE